MSNINHKPSREIPSVTKATPQRRCRTFLWNASSKVAEPISSTNFLELSLPLIIQTKNPPFPLRSYLTLSSPHCSQDPQRTVVEKSLSVKARENKQPKNSQPDHPAYDGICADWRKPPRQIDHTFPGRRQFQRARCDARNLQVRRRLELDLAQGLKNFF